MPNSTFSFCQQVSGAAILFAVMLSASCRRSEVTLPDTPPAVQASNVADIERRTKAFCGNCHPFPPPQSFPKNAWYEEVERGYEFYFAAGRHDLDPPPLIDAVNFFRDRAPDQLSLPPRILKQSQFARRFLPESVDLAKSNVVPAVSNIRIESANQDAGGRVLYCDARLGELRTIDLPFSNSAAQVLAQLGNPGHVEPCDLDANGTTDYVVADLGSIYPADHDRGRVIWLRLPQGQNNWSPTVLSDGLGRVADIRPGDFNGDGKMDLMVAVFGWHKSGEILYLRNTGIRGDRPEFTSTSVDSRHGTIHIPTCDLNGDGHLDFIALISQEHEVVEAFINNGSGSFARQPIFAANDPAYGSSGIELADLDRDGDLDVLYTNGDSFDSKYLKPSHGVHWLENEGRFPFRDHQLVNVPGAYKAIAADFDNDEDLDIAVSTFVPRSQISNASLSDLTSLLLLEQTERGSFRQHVLEHGQPRHAALGIVDVDQDGDLDILAGNYFSDATDGRARLTLWRNQ